MLQTPNCSKQFFSFVSVSFQYCFDWTNAIYSRTTAIILSLHVMETFTTIFLSKIIYREVTSRDLADWRENEILVFTFLLPQSEFIARPYDDRGL
jgi:hypothetical protein